MKKQGRWNFRSITGKLLIGLVLTIMVGGMNVIPAFSEDHHSHNQNHGRSNAEHMGHGNIHYAHRGHSERRGHYHDHYGRDYYDGREYLPPPPGIGIFFPPVMIQL